LAGGPVLVCVPAAAQLARISTRMTETVAISCL
jgi:hypothetical protein